MRNVGIAGAVPRATVTTLALCLCGASSIPDARPASSGAGQPAGAPPAVTAPLRARLAIPDTTVECQFRDVLDGIGSTGAVVAWDWFEDYGRGAGRTSATDRVSHYCPASTGSPCK
jgi:hypothetical protein